MGKLNEGLFSSKDQTWETPQCLFDNLNNVFKFTLDVCATPETSKCDVYFTPEIDGLSQDWNGNVCWMNPPYGREQIKWISKAQKESLSNTTVVCLIPARTDTRVWHDVIFPNARAVCFVRGRLKFGGSKSSAPFPSAIIVFGNEITAEQKDVLKNIGALFVC